MKVHSIILFSCIFAITASKTLNDLNANGLRRTVEQKTFANPERHYKLDKTARIKRMPIVENANGFVANTEIPKPMMDFQKFLWNAKDTCVKKMQLPPTVMQKSLMNEGNPTPTEKCLMACMLQHAGIMNDNNKLATTSIAHLAKILSDNDAFVVSSALAAAMHCNQHITAMDECEAAAQINKCMAKEIRSHELPLTY